MAKAKLALIPVAKYDEQLVYDAVKKGFELLGGIEQFVSTEEKILVKPNLLFGAAPEKAVTTHPDVLGAVFRCLREAGCKDLCYGDSSGSPVAVLEKTVEISGLKPMAEKYSVPLGDFGSAVNVSYPEGKTAKKFPICKAAVDADAIISVCKMKTHALENITGAVKNQYGLIYSANKALGHAKYPNSKIFADMMADLNNCIKPRFYVMDGILAMEGNGPGSGDPTPMNVILMSADPVALDSVFAKLIYLEPENVPTCTSGAAYGLGTMDFSEIEILTPDGAVTADQAQKSFGNADFKVNRKKISFWRASSLLPSLSSKLHKPVVDLNKCVGCGICQEACPVEGKAVHSGNGKKAEYDYKKCIRCYCCQEMCPAKAITKK